ncbi:MAG: phosphatidate cytidylyltransferase [Lachnospiraceae bacterium]|nr:phosphatidate cytidylyltransferase [Lachnospiraceae bacterium]
MSAIKKLLTKSFLERLLSGIVLLAIALFTIIIGDDVLFVTIATISFIGLFELLRVFKLQWKPIGIVGYLATIIYYTLIRTELSEYLIILFIGYLICLMAVYVLTFPKFKALDMMVGFFAFFYVVIMLSYVYQIRMLTDGKYVVWLIFLCSWGCDTCAYLVGVMFGKHKMAPVLSPKKSIEGGIGGVVGAGLLGLLYATIFKDKLMIDNANIVFPIVCAIGAIISQLGDLCASGIKRDHEIKDYSKLIPGHGGILDRFDSVIITAPIIFYLISYLVKLM